ncbi:CDP-alcohol phosphatidyltransferase family protein [Nocardioides marmoribigeumensis]|uniref:Phosphatidylglycerophosphate synthase n=1 Tax=Nocardioides marmoribigeumensis TaxID=433649 RepID=A0ABU2C0K1_9ACTN|nr:CDP-alcohol phosphatidyltransferase family protein [Nocardioides marmoribigeumensis]MDR7364171.1 phosphatidylglycerophosphate synthase [Nocardioides marmoribigeumensis]
MRPVHPTPADRVTAARLVLALAVAVLALVAVAGHDARPVLCLLAAVALPLDAVDGHVARRTGTVTARGAHFDAETDALLVLALSTYVATSLGWWVLAVGAARYALLLAQAVCPPLRGPLRPAYWRKVVAALQGVALLAAATGFLPRVGALAVVAVALALLVVSFGTEVVERLTGAGAGPTILDGLAVALVWAAPALPTVTRVPVEALVLVALVLVLPGRVGRALAVTVGAVGGLLLVLKVLDLGFRAVLDRDFRPVADWTYLPSAVGVLSDSVGGLAARAAAVGAVVAAVTAVVLVPLATVRTCALARRHPLPATRAVLGLAAVALVTAPLGAGGLSSASARLAVAEVRTARADLHDRGVFAAQIARDPFGSVPGDHLLQGLRGKDVLLVFVESYGRSAVQDSSYAPGIRAVLAAGSRRLGAAGYRSRSGFLTSPTFGAGSWLAHASVQSGLWVSGQRRYEQLLATRRLTLSTAFDRAGWRTLLDVPADTEDWPAGEHFYGVDQLHDSRDVGYRGPRFGYAPVPDQYTLDWFARHELTPGDRRPVMAEIDLVSSHHPWAPLPRLVPWDRVGDGSVFHGMPQQGESAAEVLADTRRVRSAYGRSVEYTLRTVVSFLARSGGDLVVVMLGDHQPHHYVSGAHPGYDVPVTLIAKDPAVVRRAAGWGWEPGLLPSRQAPVWRMDAFRDRFLAAFAEPTRRR